METLVDTVKRIRPGVFEIRSLVGLDRRVRRVRPPGQPVGPLTPGCSTSLAAVAAEPRRQLGAVLEALLEMRRGSANDAEEVEGLP